MTPTQEILTRCIELMKQKSSDYDHPTRHQDGLDNFRTAEELGIPAWLGALSRLQDKNQRIKTLTYKLITSGEGPAVVDETIEDTLMDAINYNAIVLALYRQWVEAGRPLAWKRPSVNSELRARIEETRKYPLEAELDDLAVVARIGRTEEEPKGSRLDRIVRGRDLGDRDSDDPHYHKFEEDGGHLGRCAYHLKYGNKCGQTREYHSD